MKNIVMVLSLIFPMMVQCSNKMASGILPMTPPIAIPRAPWIVQNGSLDAIQHCKDFFATQEAEKTRNGLMRNLLQELLKKVRPQDENSDSESDEEKPNKEDVWRMSHVASPLEPNKQ